MRRTIRMSAHELEQIARGAGGIDRIFRGLQAVEPELAVLVGAELAS